MKKLVSSIIANFHKSVQETIQSRKELAWMYVEWGYNMAEQGHELEHARIEFDLMQNADGNKKN
jgi:hypothetical protein